MNAAFIVDGNKDIGLGHITRCLTLADEMKTLRTKSVFMVRSAIAEKIINEKGFSSIRLPSTKWHNLLSAIERQLKLQDISIVITDSYEIDESFLYELKNTKKTLVSVDDLNLHPFPSDIVINGNIYAQDLTYKSSTSTKLLLGTKYLLLRKEFRQLPERKISKNINTLLITFGGSDPHNLTETALKAVTSGSEVLLRKLNIDVILGPAFNNTDKLKSNYYRKNIRFHIEPKDIGTLMLGADLAISAGGSTLYELSACGTPAITIIAADNQAMIVDKLNEYGVIKNLGFYNEINENQIISSIEELASDFDKRKEMSVKGQKLVDGFGAKRCAEYILNFEGALK